MKINQMYDILLIVNGVLPHKSLLQELKKKSGKLLCLDGAYDTLLHLSIQADILMGDFDSISQSSFPESLQIIHTPDQNYSDLEKAIQWLIENNYKEIAVCGTSGGRLDHIFVNLALMIKYSNYLNFHYFDNESKAQILQPGNYSIQGKSSQIFSILALDTVTNLTISGSKYDLSDSTISLSSNGLSNVFKEDIITIAFSAGRLLFIQIV